MRHARPRHSPIVGRLMTTLPCRQILYSLNMLPMDLYIVRARMLLIGSAINSDRRLVKKYVEYSGDKGNLQWLLDYNVSTYLSTYSRLRKQRQEKV